MKISINRLLWHWYTPKPKNNKSFEIQLSVLLPKTMDLELQIGYCYGSPLLYINFLDLFRLSLQWRRKQDHAGIEFNTNLLGVDLDLNYTDIRHWNYDADRFETQEEIDQENFEYQQSLKQ